MKTVTQSWPKIASTLVVLLLIAYAGLGQELHHGGTRVTQKKFDNSMSSAEAANLRGVSGGLPVNLFTGAVSVNLPLVQLTSRQLSLPVAMQYISNGVNVHTPSTWTGHSWRLEAGGAISRELRGLPDETPTTGYLTTGEKVQTYTDLPEDQQADWANASVERVRDTEPDLFHYHFGGKSGKFLFDHNQKIHFIPHQDFSVAYEYTEDNRLSQFTIVTENGTRYTFGDEDLSNVEETKLTVLNYNIAFHYKHAGVVANRDEMNQGTANNPVEPKYVSGFYYNYKPEMGGAERKEISNGYYTSQWHLSKIQSPNQDDYIDFTYSNVDEITQVSHPSITETFPSLGEFSSQVINGVQKTAGLLELQPPAPGVEASLSSLGQGPTEPDPNAPPPPELLYMKRDEGSNGYGSFISLSRSKTQTKTKRLSSIRTSTGNQVKFITSDNQSGVPGDIALTGIELMNFQNKLIKKFTLKYKNIRSSTAFSDPLSIDEAVLLDMHDVALTPGSGKDLIEARRASLSGSKIEEDHWKEFIFEGMKGYNYNRLFLEEIEEEGSQPGKALSHRFRYNNPEKLPRITSMKVGKTGFIRDSYSRRAPDKGYVQLRYYREVELDNEQKMFKQNYDVIYAVGPDAYGDGQIGMLQEITYPTGGKKAFAYQDGRVTTVHKITDYDHTGQVAMVKRLEYRGYVDPNPLLFASFRQYYLNANEALGNNTFTSYSQKSGGIGGAGFNTVTVYQQSDADDAESTIGKEEYNFTTYGPRYLTNDSWDDYSQEPTGINTKVYSFPNESESEEHFVDVYPFPRDHDVSYQTGLLKRHAVYGSDEKKRRETIYAYKFGHEDFPGSVIKGLVGGKFVYGTKTVTKFFGGKTSESLHRYRGGLYEIHTKAVYLDEKTEYVYEQEEADKMVTATQYEYNPTYLQVKKETTTDSEGTEWLTEYRYPTDYKAFFRDQLKKSSSEDRFSKSGASVAAMNFFHRHNTVLEKITKRKRTDESNHRVVRGALTLFSKPTSGNSINPYQQLQLAVSEPLENFRHLDFTEADDNTVSEYYDSHYSFVQTFDKYDNKGNLLQQTGRDQIPSSQLYSYQASLPIAQVAGAKTNQIAYTSFETANPYNQEGNFQWTYSDNVQTVSNAVSGNRVYQSNGGFGASVATINEFPVGEYQVSLWVKSAQPDAAVLLITKSGTEKIDIALNGEWYCATKRVSLAETSKISLIVMNEGMMVDEVRIHPVGAQMTTYTYNPLIGITSETDANNLTTYYEYDNHNRLQLLKDQRKDIRQHYQYVYKNQ